MYDEDIEVYNKNGLSSIMYLDYYEKGGLSCELEVKKTNHTNRNLWIEYDRDQYNIPELVLKMRYHYGTFAHVFDNEREQTFPMLSAVPKEDRNEDDDLDYAVYEWFRRFNE